jgi:hypothetical protein
MGDTQGRFARGSGVAERGRHRLTAFE